MLIWAKPPETYSTRATVSFPQWFVFVFFFLFSFVHKHALFNFLFLDYGTVKLDVKTRTQNGIDFNVTGEHNNDVQKSLGTLEAKYKVPAQGLTFVEKWNTDNVLKSELTFEDNLVRGLKLTLDTSYAPASGYESNFVLFCIWLRRE